MSRLANKTALKKTPNAPDARALIRASCRCRSLRGSSISRIRASATSVRSAASSVSSREILVCTGERLTGSSAAGGGASCRAAFCSSARSLSIVRAFRASSGSTITSSGLIDRGSSSPLLTPLDAGDNSCIRHRLISI